MSIQVIANWQLDAQALEVELLALQRGYVWKPKQVETLWDSQLRGFPIGSFFVAETEGISVKKVCLMASKELQPLPWDFTILGRKVNS